MASKSRNKHKNRWDDLCEDNSRNSKPAIPGYPDDEEYDYSDENEDVYSDTNAYSDENSNSDYSENDEYEEEYPNEDDYAENNEHIDETVQFDSAKYTKEEDCVELKPIKLDAPAPLLDKQKSKNLTFGEDFRVEDVVFPPIKSEPEADSKEKKKLKTSENQNSVSGEIAIENEDDSEKVSILNIAKLRAAAFWNKIAPQCAKTGTLCLSWLLPLLTFAKKYTVLAFTFFRSVEETESASKELTAEHSSEPTAEQFPEQAPAHAGKHVPLKTQSASEEQTFAETQIFSQPKLEIPETPTKPTAINENKVSRNQNDADDKNKKTKEIIDKDAIRVEDEIQFRVPLDKKEKIEEVDSEDEDFDEEEYLAAIRSARIKIASVAALILLSVGLYFGYARFFKNSGSLDIAGATLEDNNEPGGKSREPEKKKSSTNQSDLNRNTLFSVPNNTANKSTSKSSNNAANGGISSDNRWSGMEVAPSQKYASEVNGSLPEIEESPSVPLRDHEEFDYNNDYSVTTNEPDSMPNYFDETGDNDQSDNDYGKTTNDLPELADLPVFDSGARPNVTSEAGTDLDANSLDAYALDSTTLDADSLDTNALDSNNMDYDNLNHGSSNSGSLTSSGVLDSNSGSVQDSKYNDFAEKESEPPSASPKELHSNNANTRSIGKNTGNKLSANLDGREITLPGNAEQLPVPTSARSARGNLATAQREEKTELLEAVPYSAATSTKDDPTLDSFLVQPHPQFGNDEPRQEDDSQNEYALPALLPQISLQANNNINNLTSKNNTDNFPGGIASSQNTIQLGNAADQAVNPQGRVYVVKDGDNLFNIAKRQLGSVARWNEIYRLNRQIIGKDVDYLTPGLELQLPPDNLAGTNSQSKSRTRK
ncbi:MAG: LysM peptidoglycan-binding domain-containing protein [Thermoguttaceae bacterium]